MLKFLLFNVGVNSKVQPFISHTLYHISFVITKVWSKTRHNALHFAVTNKATEIIALLSNLDMDLKFMLTQQNASGKTPKELCNELDKMHFFDPIWRIAQKGQCNRMRIYLDRNLFRVDERTIISGNTALIYASRSPRHDRMMKLLLEYGADPWIENKSG